MKRVTIRMRKYVNILEQDGRVIVGYHAMPLDERGTPVTEVVECDRVDISEFCVQMLWVDATSEREGGLPPRATQQRSIPLDLIYDVRVEEA